MGLSFKTSKCNLEITGTWQNLSGLGSLSLARTQDLLPPNVCSNLSCCLEMKSMAWSPRLGQPGRTKTETGPQSARRKTQRRAEIFVPTLPSRLAPSSTRPDATGARRSFKDCPVLHLRLRDLGFGIPALFKQSTDENTKRRGCCRSRRLIFSPQQSPSNEC